MAKRKNNTDVFLYGGAGLASGLLINEIQDFYLYYYILNEQYKGFKDITAKFGRPAFYWWYMFKINIDEKYNLKTKEQADALRAEAANDFTDVTAEQIQQVREYARLNWWWTDAKKLRFKYQYTNYALIIAGILPLLKLIKNKTLQFVLYGAAVTGVYNTIRLNLKAYNIYKKLQPAKTLKDIYYELIKIINKELYTEANDTANLYAWQGYLLFTFEDTKK